MKTCNPLRIRTPLRRTRGGVYPPASRTSARRHVVPAMPRLGAIPAPQTEGDKQVIHQDELREQLAAIEHERWADWQQWMHGQCQQQEDGSLVIPAERVAHWERQIATPYAELSRDEQLSDLKQVDRYWPLILAALADMRGRIARDGESDTAVVGRLIEASGGA